MRQGSQRLARLATVAVALAIPASGCGREKEADLVTGKTLFTQKCGSCHALERAGTKGKQGPDLDEAFGPARRDGLGEGTVEGVVLDQISLVRKNSTMPADLVVGDDARAVAAYVAQVAGQPGKDQGALANAGKPKVSNKPIAAKGGKLQIDADPTGALAFVTSKATAMAGPLMFVSENKASIPHNIAVRDQGGKLLGEGPDVTGGTSKFSTKVKAGKYTFVCTVPGHEEGGMKGDLTVK
ncbi:MAG TPA: plastocyanin/azurin family copper-binding protein [Thermoleophilaceae bacterium]|nr:plastocyanin/azurin family copper-binding protein [Thermoleophilaceae bacterium]